MFYKLSCSMVVSTTLAVLLTTTNLAAHASVTPVIRHEINEGGSVR